MEGVVYSLADCNEILKKLGTEVVSMRACGGGSRSPVWRKIMADLYKCDVHTLKQEEGPAYGCLLYTSVPGGKERKLDSVSSGERTRRSLNRNACIPGLRTAFKIL